MTFFAKPTPRRGMVVYIVQCGSGILEMKR